MYGTAVVRYVRTLRNRRMRVSDCMVAVFLM